MVYLIPTKGLSQKDSNIFINNEVSIVSDLSNWLIRISIHTIPQSEIYSIENLMEKLKN